MVNSSDVYVMSKCLGLNSHPKTLQLKYKLDIAHPPGRIHFKPLLEVLSHKTSYSSSASCRFHSLKHCFKEVTADFKANV